MKTLPCRACGGVMRKETLGGGVMRFLALIVFLMIAGALALFVHWLAGVAMLVVIAFLDRAGKKVWKCQQCEAVIDRG